MFSSSSQRFLFLFFIMFHGPLVQGEIPAADCFIPQVGRAEYHNVSCLPFPTIEQDFGPPDECSPFHVLSALMVPIPFE